MSRTLKRIAAEVRKMDADMAKAGAVGHFTVTPDGSDANKWHVDINGPERYQGPPSESGEREERACPYAGRHFTGTVEFGDNYPFSPMTFRFDTPAPYHPNIDQEKGELCEDFVKSFWAPTRKCVDYIEHIYTLLSNPDPETALDADIAAQYRDNIAAFEAKAASTGGAPGAAGGAGGAGGK